MFKSLFLHFRKKSFLNQNNVPLFSCFQHKIWMLFCFSLMGACPRPQSITCSIKNSITPLPGRHVTDRLRWLPQVKNLPHHVPQQTVTRSLRALAAGPVRQVSAVELRWGHGRRAGSRGARAESERTGRRGAKHGAKARRLQEALRTRSDVSHRPAAETRWVQRWRLGLQVFVYLETHVQLLYLLVLWKTCWMGGLKPPPQS